MRCLQAVRVCLIIAVGCQQSSPAPHHDEVAPAAPAPRDAQPAPAPRADAEVIPAFEFSGTGVPTGFGGISLGDPLPTPAQRMGTYAGINAAWLVASDDGSTVAQITISIGDDVEAALAKRFGRADHKIWKGPASWMIDSPQPFDFSGSANTRLVIVRPDGHHICARDDGFTSFYAGLQRAARAHDWAAVAGMMTFPQTDWVDSEGAETSVQVSTPEDLIRAPTEVFRFELAGGNITCDLGNRTYTIVYGDARLSPAIYVARKGNGWTIVDVGHAPHDLH